METDQGYERDGWRAINTALGLTAICIPEAYRGYGFSFGDQCIVLEEMGRALLCAPTRFPSSDERRRKLPRHGLLGIVPKVERQGCLLPGFNRAPR